MTLWHEGTPFIPKRKVRQSFNMELVRPPKGQSNGRYLLKAFICELGFAWYTIRYWTPTGQTPWTDEKQISGRNFAGDNTQILLSEDGNLQFFTKENDFKEPTFYIDPGDLEEIKEIEGEDPP